MPLPETIQHLRAQYERGAVVPAIQSHKRILARNDVFFISEFSPNKWQTDYERRKKNLSCGFFSPNTLSYKACGEMRHLDCYELVKERLKIVTASCPPPSSQERYQKEIHTNHQSHVIRVARTSAQKRAVPKSRSAGLSDIVLELNASKRGMQSTKAGSSFISMAGVEERRKAIIHATKTTKTVELNGKSVTVHNPSVFLSQLVNTAGSKTCLVMQGNMHRQSRQHTVWHDPNEVKELLEERPDNLVNTSDDSDKASVEQIKKRFFAKLQSVYAILCCISGIKLKDLKNKETLTLDAIKALHHKPHSPLPKSQFYSHNHKQYFQNPLLPKNGNSPRIIRNGPQRKVHRTKDSAYNHGKDKRLICTSNSQQLCRLPSPPQPSLSAAIDSRRIIPAWQRQTIYVEDESHQLDREGQLKEKISAYHHLKGVVASAAKAAIKKRQLHLQDYLLAKMKELNQNSGVDSKDVLNLARKKAFEQTRDREAEEKENNPSWLCELQKEACLTFGQDNRSVQRQLEDLRIFIGINSSTPCVIEKLCYFVMSLPANHLCTRPMIAAIQFVLEYVINISPNLCEQWFEIRRLPFIANEVTECNHMHF